MAAAFLAMKPPVPCLPLGEALARGEDLTPSTAPGADHAWKMSSGSNAETT